MKDREILFNPVRCTQRRRTAGTPAIKIPRKVIQNLFWLFFYLSLVGFAGWLASIIGALIVRVILYLFT